MKGLWGSLSLTAMAGAIFLLALASSVCPPAVHLPVILALVSIVLFVVAFIKVVWSAKNLSSGKRVAAAMLALTQLGFLGVICWVLVRTPRGSM
jgi:hypothetical protein